MKFKACIFWVGILLAGGISLAEEAGDDPTVPLALPSQPMVSGTQTPAMP